MTITDATALLRLGIVPSLINGDGSYRLFTAMFMHSGVLHLASNMATLFYVGSRLETRTGHFKLLVAYMVCGFAGNVAVMRFSSPNTITVGASGAIFGLMGILFIQMFKTGDWKGFAVIGQNIAVNLYMTFTNSSISVSGHLGGLICGILFGFIFSFGRASQWKPAKEEMKEVKPENYHVGLLIVIATVLIIAVGTYAALSSDGQKSIKMPGIVKTTDIESVMRLSPDRTLITK